MADDPENRKPTAKQVLLESKEPRDKPVELYRQGVHLTPTGTTTRWDMTPEGRERLAVLAREKAEYERHRASLPKVPKVAREQKRNFKRQENFPYNKDKDLDLDR